MPGSDSEVSSGIPVAPWPEPPPAFPVVPMASFPELSSSTPQLVAEAKQTVENSILEKFIIQKTNHIQHINQYGYQHSINM